MRLILSILFSLMIVISSAGSPHTKHESSGNDHLRSGHSISKNSTSSTIKPKPSAFDQVKMSYHQKMMMARHGKLPGTQKHDSGSTQKKCCSMATMLTGCAQMPLCVEEDRLWAPKSVSLQAMRFRLSSNFLPSMVHPPPRSPPRPS